MEDNLAQQLYAAYQKTGVKMYRSAGEEIIRLRAENEKLRAALKPFADAVLKDEYSWKYDINSDDFRAAAAAIRESGE